MSNYDDLHTSNSDIGATQRAYGQGGVGQGPDDVSLDELADAWGGEADPGKTLRRPVQAQGASAQPRGRKPTPVVEDTVEHTLRRTATPVRNQRRGGGAVASKRSGVAAALRRRVRQENAAQEAREDERAQARAYRREHPQARNHGLGLLTRLAGQAWIKTLVLLALVVGGIYLVVLGPVDRALSFEAGEAEGLSSELSWHVPGMPYYVLALGSDAREGDEISRTDTMILVRVAPLTGKLTMLSIPRDTKVDIEGYGAQKINAAYAFGGAAGAVRAVKQLCDVPISQVALIKFDGVQELVDYLGGVTVNVPVDVYDPEYTGLILSAGEQEMDGYTALQFSRVRHGFDLGDYQRQVDQRLVIEAVMRKILSGSPLRIPGTVKHMSSLVSTSMRMYSILPLMARLKLGSTIYQATVPSTTDYIDGVSYVIADEQALDEMMGVIRSGGDPSTVTQGLLE